MTVSNKEVLINRLENALYSKGKELVEAFATEIHLYEDTGCPMEVLLDIDMDELIEKVVTRLKKDIGDELAYVEQAFDGEWSEEEDGE